MENLTDQELVDRLGKAVRFSFGSPTQTALAKQLLGKTHMKGWQEDARDLLSKIHGKTETRK